MTAVRATAPSALATVPKLIGACLSLTAMPRTVPECFLLRLRDRLLDTLFARACTPAAEEASCTAVSPQPLGVLGNEPKVTGAEVWAALAAAAGCELVFLAARFLLLGPVVANMPRMPPAPLACVEARVDRRASICVAWCAHRGSGDTCHRLIAWWSRSAAVVRVLTLRCTPLVW